LLSYVSKIFEGWEGSVDPKIVKWTEFTGVITIVLTSLALIGGTILVICPSGSPVLNHFGSLCLVGFWIPAAAGYALIIFGRRFYTKHSGISVACDRCGMEIPDGASRCPHCTEGAG
jgi:hypothetical protein